MGVKVGGIHFIAKSTIKELESLTANDAGRIIREDGNLAGRISVRKNGASVSFSIAIVGASRTKSTPAGPGRTNP
ncbi:hypothetical protein D3C80_1819250 [compost metagenome]